MKKLLVSLLCVFLFCMSITLALDNIKPIGISQEFKISGNYSVSQVLRADINNLRFDVSEASMKGSVIRYNITTLRFKKSIVETQKQEKIFVYDKVGMDLCYKRQSKVFCDNKLNNMILDNQEKQKIFERVYIKELQNVNRITSRVNMNNQVMNTNINTRINLDNPGDIPDLRDLYS